ncbi:MAG: phBC6A51 family helix-turn-helix protein [Ruminococcus sp.]|nr:phBC6A51 family helix-turn-helix protein [Ruminococcus sp.]MCM1543687.1 phBC6A51 family helix-turn-helix protein [Ruminococcus sp.]
MAKYSKKTVEKIVGLIRSDTYTIAEICRQVGINKKTYHEWINTHEEFALAVEEAREELMQSMVMVAKKSLRRKLEGYDVTETRTVTIPGKEVGEDGKPKPKVKEHITTKKHVAADTAAIIFTLTNGDPEHWKNRQNNEVTGKDGKDLFAQKTDEELAAMIQDLQRKLE